MINTLNYINKDTAQKPIDAYVGIDFNSLIIDLDWFTLNGYENGTKD